MKKLISLFALIGIFTVAAFADVRLETPTPKPKPTKTPKAAKLFDARMTIQISKDAKEARLLISKDQLKQLRSELAELDGESSDAPTASTFTRTQTVVSGLFLSLAFVFGGVWFARSRKTGLKTDKTIAAGAVLFLSGAFATIAFANIGPPFETRSITGEIFSNTVNQTKRAYGDVKIEVTNENYGLTLIVPEAKNANKSEEE